jgi:hypothetical protein
LLFGLTFLQSFDLARLVLFVFMDVVDLLGTLEQKLTMPRRTAEGSA